MKTLINSILVAACALNMCRCGEEISTDEPVRLQFTIGQEEELSELLTGTSLLLSIETVSGLTVVRSEPVSFLQVGRYFVTAPLKLAHGEYSVTEFALVNDAGETLYAVPHANSLLASAVMTPLSFKFNVRHGTSEEISQLNLLSVANQKPEDFGMKSFKRGYSLTILVTTPDGRRIPASAAILRGTDTLAKYELAPKLNHVDFSGNANETYTLTVTRSAYTSFSQSFTPTLTKPADRRIIRIVLKPAFTMVGNGEDPENPGLSFYIGGTDGFITIDWGDSTIETYELTKEIGLEHNYPEHRAYPITITGDLDKITSFYSFYGYSVFNDIRFDHLTNMNEIRFGLTHCPKVIDLSHNQQLAFVMMPHLMEMEKLYLPAVHKIGYITIDGTNQLATAEVDAIIDNIYSNTVSQDIHDGIFSLASSWIPGEGNTLLGPPSAASLVKLDLLRQHYGWSIWQPGDPVDQRIVSEQRKMRERFRVRSPL